MKTRASRLIVLLSLLAGPVWAGTGAIEINQASVTAAGGFPFTISQPGSYVLTSNLVVPNENTGALLITAEGVTLDLSGFGIRGPVTCTGEATTRNQNIACSVSGTGIGIFVESAATAVIRNGFVRGMGGRGILAGGNLTTVLENMVVEENAGHGVDLYQGRLVDSAVRFNGGNGVEECDCGGSGNNQIEHNVVERNRGAGIHTGKGSVKENYIFYNGGAGVLVTAGGSNSAHVVGNTIESNSGNGINAFGGVYRDNMLRSNLQTTGHQVVGSITDGGGNSCSPAC